jgi:RNA polymerase sigma-70 factor (ECF subfamily)
MAQATRLIVRPEGMALPRIEALPYSEFDGSALVERAALGDSEAFGEIYSVYIDRISRYVLYQVRDKMTAEDLTEEIFMKAWKAIGSFSGESRALSTWLYRIAHNYVIDYFRTKRQQPLLTSQITDDIRTSDAIVDPEQMVQTKLMQEEVLELVSGLAEQQREIIVLKFIEGLDNYEIEQITGRSQGAIRISQMRALTTLREKLNGRELLCRC